MERRRRAQAAGAAFRGLGPDRRGHGQRAQAAVVDLVLLRIGRHASTLAAFLPRKRGRHEPGYSPRMRAESDMPMNVDYQTPADLPDTIPVFPLPGALLLPRGQMPLNI